MKLSNLIIACCFVVMGLGSLSGQKALICSTLKSQSHNPIGFANIIFLNKKDSTIIDFTQSDINGVFCVPEKILSKDNVLLKVTHISYETTYREVSRRLDTIIVLKEHNIHLKNAIVVGDKKVSYHHDTATYNANNYRDSSESVLQELLAKIPGVTVEPNSGKVLVSGRPIKTILIEGDDLSESNYKLISRNMPAIAIKKIQVIYNYRPVEEDHNKDAIALNISNSGREHKILKLSK